MMSVNKGLSTSYDVILGQLRVCLKTQGACSPSLDSCQNKWVALLWLSVPYMGVYTLVLVQVLLLSTTNAIAYFIIQNFQGFKHNYCQLMIGRNQYSQRDRPVIPDVNIKMTSFSGQASWAKMMSPRGKLTALASHLTKKVNKAEELTYLSTNIGGNFNFISPT